MKRGGVGDADDQAIVREKPGHRLAPRLGTGWVQQVEARALKLAASRCDSVCVRDLELDGCLGDRPVGGPRRRAEARLGCLRERPHAEVLAARDAPARVVAVVFALQREAKGVHEESAALWRVSDDHRRTRDEENVHVTQPMGRSFQEAETPAVRTCPRSAAVSLPA
ncbi:hypothetical protein T261_00194 [Streptomyces lydicus]|nr:hypothetical protein T261_00194 [Streptomyces lydicus]